MTEFKSIYARYSYVQCRIGIKKAHNNDYGNYKYFTIGDINERLKPLLEEAGLALLVSNEVVTIGAAETPYIKATAVLYDFEGNMITNHAYAKLSPQEKGKSDPQVSGSCITYVNKYVLGAMFGIQTNEDVDALDNTDKGAEPAPAKKARVRQPDRLTEIKSEMNKLIKEDDALPEKAGQYIKNNIGKNNFTELTEPEAEGLLLYLQSISKQNKQVNFLDEAPTKNYGGKIKDIYDDFGHPYTGIVNDYLRSKNVFAVDELTNKQTEELYMQLCSQKHKNAGKGMLDSLNKDSLIAELRNLDEQNTKFLKAFLHSNESLEGLESLSMARLEKLKSMLDKIKEE